jgi:hypothetical protein
MRLRNSASFASGKLTPKGRMALPPVAPSARAPPKNRSTTNWPNQLLQRLPRRQGHSAFGTARSHQRMRLNTGEVDSDKRVQKFVQVGLEIAGCAE